MKLFMTRKIMIAVIIPALFLAGCLSVPARPRADKGVLDLRAWDTVKNGPVLLTGDWEIYWEKLLSPEDFRGAALPVKTGFMTVPGYWEGRRVNGTELHYRGVATLRLTLKTEPVGTACFLWVDKILGASKLWVNGHPVSENGTLGISASDVVEATSAEIFYEIEPDPQGSAEILLQLANFHMHPHFGPHFRMLYGTGKALRHQSHVRIGSDLLVMGAVIIMGLYHLFLFLFRRENRAALYFGGLCLCFGIWILHSGVSMGAWLHMMVPGLPWQLRVSAAYLSYYLMIGFLVLFVRSLFPYECSSRVTVITLGGCSAGILSGIALPFCAGVCFLEPLLRWLYHPMVRPTDFLLVLLTVYLTSAVFRALKKRRPGSGYMAVSILVAFTAMVHDILKALFAPGSLVLSSAGMCVMLTCQSLMLAREFSRAYSDVAHLSEVLKEKNISLSRMDRLKDEFLANTSHELRTPLNGIMGITESLLQGVCGKLPEKAQANLSMIFSSSRRLKGLINDLLDFSKLKNSDIRLQTRPVDLRSAVKVVMAVADHIKQNSGVMLLNSVPEDLPQVEADEDRLQQILYNLVGNAVKFTKEGTIDVRAKKVGNMIEVQVTDTGIGIPSDRLTMIFNAFEQADTSASRHYPGTGLGLSISRYLVELHGGNITAASTPGEGSCFSFSLPLSRKDRRLSDSGELPLEPSLPPEMMRPPPEALEESTSTDYGQVLVVDDDPVNLQVVANHLLLSEISFRTAGSGEAALLLLDRGPLPDVLVLDVMMPGMTGYQVCRKIRETVSPSEMPIILLTAKNRVEELVEGFRSGASDYLGKPFSKDELMARITCHLHLKQAYGTLAENRRLEKEVQTQILAKQRARIREAEATIAKLRYQINPHFLFNALASIRGAVRSDPALAVKMISCLSEFSRLALSKKSESVQTIRKELEATRLYLDMEALRFGDYLKISIETDPETAPLMIPSLLIQPLAENAVKFGSRTCPDDLEIVVTAEMKANNVCIRVANTGSWIEPGNFPAELSTGTGIANVRNRLEQHFQGRAAFAVHESAGQVVAELRLPLNPEKSDDETECHHN